MATLSRSSILLKILIQVAGEHTVIELADLVRAAAVEPLKALVRGDHVDLPGGKRCKMTAEVAVERFYLLDRAESFAVGRVCDYRSASAGCADRARKYEKRKGRDTVAIILPFLLWLLYFFSSDFGLLKFMTARFFGS